MGNAMTNIPEVSSLVLRHGLPRHEREQTPRGLVITLELKSYLRPNGIYLYDDLTWHCEKLAAYYGKHFPKVQIYVNDVPHLSFVLSGSVENGKRFWSADGWKKSWPTAAQAWTKRD